MKNTSLKLVVLYGLALLLVALTSCNTLKKIVHRETIKTDSVSVSYARIDSASTHDSTSVHSAISDDEIVIDFGDPRIYTKDTATYGDNGIYVYPQMPNDYLEISKDGTIKTTKAIRKLTIRNTSKIIDSTSTHAAVHYEKQTSDSTHLTKSTKTTAKEKEVHRMSPLFMAILIGAIAVFLALWVRRKARQMKGPFVPPL
jgi:hypothetical protein